MSEYFVTFECDCGKTIKQRVMWVSGGIPEIPWDNASQTTFECDCGNKYFTGDFDYMTEEEL